MSGSRHWMPLVLLSLSLPCLVRSDSDVEGDSGFQTCIADPPSCTSLDLESMELTGTIPTEMGYLTSLTGLYLSDNELTGSIPTELGYLTDLRWPMRLTENSGLCGYAGHVTESDWIEGTNVGIDCDLDSNNRNGIMRAAISGDEDDMTAALNQIHVEHPNIDLMDNTTLGYNALMLAAQYDHQDVARMLLDAGANTSALTSTDSTETNNWSNIFVAAWYGDQAIVSLYLTASIEHLDTPVDYYAMTPLHAAVSRGHCATAAVLTGFGANVNAVDSDNMTPLHYAAKNGHSTCTQTLLAAGADKSAVSAAGKTACDYAEDSDHHVITEALTSCDVIVD